MNKDDKPVRVIVHHVDPDYREGTTFLEVIAIGVGLIGLFTFIGAKSILGLIVAILSGYYLYHSYKKARKRIRKIRTGDF